MSPHDQTHNDKPNSQEQDIALEQRDEIEQRLFSPSAARNCKLIVDAYQALMPQRGTVLEIASGTGEHGFHITNACPQLCWQPSDPDAKSRLSIDAWAAFANHVAIEPALNLDVTKQAWIENLPICDGVVSINMIHIAPFAAVEGLFSGSVKLLKPGAKLFLYGPFKRHGETATSNIEFDASLKSRNPAWGVRDLDLDLVPLAARHKMILADIREMPANNLCVTFQKR